MDNKTGASHPAPVLLLYNLTMIVIMHNNRIRNSGIWDNQSRDSHHIGDTFSAEEAPLEVHLYPSLFFC